MIADAPKNHLRGHALVDSVQQLLDETRAGLSGHELKRTAALKLTFGVSKPPPRTFWLTKDVLA
jgi:hypothetical protein